MSNWKEPISLIRKRLKDWLIYSSVGNNVDHLDLDLLNRAQMWLSQYRQWDMLTKYVPLTLVGKTAVLPDDLNSICDGGVCIDIGGIGKPTVFFYPNSPDIATRYTYEDVYTKEVGHSSRITFSASAIIQGPLYLKYTCNLPDFVGTDENGDELIEFSFFPPNLLLRCAQKLHCEDKGVTGDSQQMLLNSFGEELRKFEMNSQYSNQQMDLTVKNKYGMPMRISGHSLDGSRNPSGNYSSYLPSTMMHGI